MVHTQTPFQDTADSFFFEYDPGQTSEEEQYMIMALDEHSILRLIDGTPQVVEVIKAMIDRLWTLGLEAEGCIGVGKNRQKLAPDMEETISWEFVLKGSPWRAPASKIARSRQFITYLLDGLLAHGWTVVTGLDISRSRNKKSALLFQRCPPVTKLPHACLSPLGKEQYQLINAPTSLRLLVKKEFGDMVLHEKLTENDSVYEILLTDRQWWVADPEHEKDSYIFARKRMGHLLQTLMDANWSVIASADVAQEILETDSVDVGEGIHSWFVIYCGTDDADSAARVTANSVLQVGGRIGSARRHSLSTYERWARLGVSTVTPRAASLSTRQAEMIKQRRAKSPPPNYEQTLERLSASKSRGGHHSAWK